MQGEALKADSAEGFAKKGTVSSSKRKRDGFRVSTYLLGCGVPQSFVELHHGDTGPVLPSREVIMNHDPVAQHGVPS